MQRGMLSMGEVTGLISQIGKTILQILRDCKDTHWVRKLRGKVVEV